MLTAFSKAWKKTHYRNADESARFDVGSTCALRALSKVVSGHIGTMTIRRILPQDVDNTQMTDDCQVGD